jgi:YD repeat-containing protein
MRSNLLYSVLAATLVLPTGMSVRAQWLDGPDRGIHPDWNPDAVTQTGPSGIITTVAGDGYIGDDGNGGLATKAHLIFPQGVAVDSAGNFYIADSLGEVVRKVTVSTGIITAFAGTGDAGYSGDNGPATKAQLNDPLGLAVDADNNVYIADGLNNVIRRVDAKTGVITTVAGNGFGAGTGRAIKCGVRTDGIAATASSLCFPQAAAVDKDGNLFIADSANNVIRKVAVATGIITTVAGGSGTYYSLGDGGLAVNALLDDPGGVAVDSLGNLYIADTYDCEVRKVTVATGIITSVAGGPARNGGYQCGLSGDGGPATQARIEYPQGVALDRTGNVFFADSQDSVVRMISASNGNIYTIAGSYLPGVINAITTYPGYAGDEGPAAYAELEYPYALAADSAGSLYIADTDNSAVRKVAHASVLPTEAPLLSPPPGTLTNAASVTLSSPVSGATIYYTTDASIPTTSSTKYTAPIGPIGTKIITAFATIPGAPNSPASVGRYFFAPTPVISPGTENITKATPVTITDGNAGAAIYYTTDGSSPNYSQTAKKYTGAIGISATTTLLAQAEIVDAQGHAGWSATATATYSLTGPPTILDESVQQETATEVDLTAQINPDNETTQYWFAYGTSATALTSSTATAIGLTGTASTNVNAYVNGLKPNATYYFQVVATNSKGTATGAVVKFNTGFYVASPVIAPATEIINSATQVTITEANPAAAIYYTTDGSYPQTSQTAARYTGPIKVSTTTAITAQAEVTSATQGNLWSQSANALYTVPTAPTVTSEAANEQSATQEQLTAYISPNGATTQYWFAWGSSSASLTNIAGKTTGVTGTLGVYASFSIAGLKANATYYYQAVATNSLGTAKGPVQSFTTDFYAPTPVISPGSENISKPIKVAITQSNPSAAIFYTTDGSDVCNNAAALKYSGPITISATITITAVTEAVGPSNTLCSDTASATYVLPTAPVVTTAGFNQESATEVQVTAVVSASGAPTEYWIAYGTTAAALTTTTAKTPGLNGITSYNVSNNLIGLKPNTTYFYQAVASNSLGTGKGLVASFRTDYYTPTPVISPGSETISKPIKVTITQSNPAAALYYTTDGSYPCYNSAAIQYNGPITISATTVLMAATQIASPQGGTLCGETVTDTYVLPTQPVVETDGYSELSSNEEQVTGTVNPSGAPTESWFAYGTTAAALTSTTAKTPLPAGITSGGVSVNLTGLKPNTTYYYQAVASNSVGTVKGLVVTFRTDYYTPTPVISPGSEDITKPIKVTISQSNPAAVIFYTTDGSYVCNNSQAVEYNGPVTISTTTTLNAVTEVFGGQGYFMCGTTATATYIVPAAPTVTDESVAAYWTDFAQVSANIDPNGETTQYWVAYGTSATALTSATAKTGGLAGGADIYETVTVNGLTTKTTYYYQVVASNSLGTAKGPVQSFTTQ